MVPLNPSKSSAFSNSCERVRRRPPQLIESFHVYSPWYPKPLWLRTPPSILSFLNLSHLFPFLQATCYHDPWSPFLMIIPPLPGSKTSSRTILGLLLVFSLSYPFFRPLVRPSLFNSPGPFGTKELVPSPLSFDSFPVPRSCYGLFPSCPTPSAFILPLETLISFFEVSIHRLVS